LNEDDTGVAAPPALRDGATEIVGAADWGQREFALREWMDGPCTYAAYRAGALDLERVNWWTRGYRPTLQFLERVVARTRVGYEPLHVLDVGCGHGDGLRAMHRWAARRSVPLKLTGVDLNPYAARLARECDRREHVSAGTITWLTADAFATELERPADVVVSSLFAHHLDDEALVRLLQWKDANARVAWVVSDLRRSERAAMGFAWLTRVLRMNAMVKHDGAMSFRRALSIAEWEAIVKRAGVRAVVRDVGLGRLVVEKFCA
jgi:SAM-dependent methyltransferase